jgi:hypothetical protein
MIADACAPSIATRKDGLGRVFASYRAPMEAWLRSCGDGAERAAEITQAFFTDVVLRRDILSSATEGRGRLRNLIKTALKRYRIDLVRRDEAREHAECRAAENRGVPAVAAADEAFDAEWARTQLQLALDRVRARLEAAGRMQEWRVFELCVLEPTLHHAAPPTMDEVTVAIGVRNSATGQQPAPSSAQARGFGAARGHQRDRWRGRGFPRGDRAYRVGAPHCGASVMTVMTDSAESEQWGKLFQ